MLISVIIPTLNEEESIDGLIRFIRMHRHIAEVIVVDAGSADRTAQIAAAAGALVLSSPVQSRASQMNMGAAMATGEILYFVHADVKVVKCFDEDILASVRAGHHAGCYRFAFDSTHRMLKINAYFTRFSGIMCRGGDQTLFITKGLFSMLKGFDENYTIMEDYDLIRRIPGKAKFRIIPKDIVVSPRKYKTNSWLRVQVVNAAVLLLFLANIRPARLKSFYKKALHSY